MKWLRIYEPTPATATEDELRERVLDRLPSFCAMIRNVAASDMNHEQLRIIDDHITACLDTLRKK